MLGNNLEGLEKHDEAIDAYKRDLEIDPQNVSTWNSLGDSLFSLKRYEEAVDAHKRALEIDPQNANAWSNLGVNLKTLEKYEAARDAFKRALEINPDQEKARSFLEELTRDVVAAPLPERIIEKETVIREVYLVICPHCSAKSPQGSIACQKCGADL